MKRGLSFYIENPRYGILYGIFSDFEGINSTWLINELEVIGNIDDNIKNAESLTLSSNEFSTFIKLSFSPLFGIFQAFPLNAKIERITDYNSFLASDCQTVLLCSDLRHFEMYCKNENDIEFFIQKALREKCSRVEVTTENNDFRKKFSLW